MNSNQSLKKSPAVAYQGNSLAEKPFAEVIESSLQSWLAQSWQWNDFPAFGSLLTIETKKRTLFGIVHEIQTGSMEPMRHPFPYKKTEEELMQEQPQIFEFLKTTFSCLTVGYSEPNNNILYLLAPEPPQIHSFVSMASREISMKFFSSEQYLHLLFNASQKLFNIEELLLALLKSQSNLGILTKRRVAHFIEMFSLLTGNDYRRLKLFLQRVEPHISLKS